MQIVIDIDEVIYKRILPYKDVPVISNLANDFPEIMHAVSNGVPLPKGHGRLIDESQIKKCGWNFVNHHAKTNAPTIIEADEEYEDEIITRGNCMMCGKKLDEGLFFCRECEARAESEE